MRCKVSKVSLSESSPEFVNNRSIRICFNSGNVFLDCDCVVKITETVYEFLKTCHCIFDNLTLGFLFRFKNVGQSTVATN